MPSMMYFVDGENCIIHSASGKPSNIHEIPTSQGTWKYGDFGEASEDVAKESGKCDFLRLKLI